MTQDPLSLIARRRPSRTLASLTTSLMLLSLAILPKHALAAPQYQFVDLNPSGAINSLAFGVSGGQQVGIAYGPNDASNFHSILWSSTTASAVDLNPAWAHGSFAFGASDGKQVGSAWGNGIGQMEHALLWSGTAASAVDLNPYGRRSSRAIGISGSQQVGWATIDPNRSNEYTIDPSGAEEYAMLWSGTAAGAVDLNPSWAYISVASGVSDGHQVGYATGYSTQGEHAMLWSGTAASAVDLNPSWAWRSNANGVSGSRQVGYATATGQLDHAMLWSGTAASAVDLNPSGYDGSEAFSLFGDQQVGWAWNNSTSFSHAMIWSGTSQSAFDLQQFLPSGVLSSRAQCIDENGNIVGYAQMANGETHAFMLTPTAPVPEPAFLQLGTLLGGSGFGLLRLRRRRA